jgi:hypothetical protein
MDKVKLESNNNNNNPIKLWISTDPIQCSSIERIKTAFVFDTADHLTHNLPKTESEKTTKHENLALEIKNIWKLNNTSAYPVVISTEREVAKSFLKCLQNIGLTRNIARMGQNTVLLLRAAYSHCP